MRRSASSSSGGVRDVASQFRATSNHRLKRVTRGGFDTEDPRTGERQSRRTFTVGGGGARRSSSMVGLNGTQQQQQHTGFAQQQHAAAPVPPPRVKRAARSVESSSRARPSSIPRPLHQHQHPRQQVIPPVAAVQPRDPRQVAQQHQQRHQRQAVRPRPPPPALSKRFTTRTEDLSRESRKTYPTSSSSSSSSPANASKRVPKRLPPTPDTTAEATKRGGRGGGGGSGLQMGRRRRAEENGIGFGGEPTARVRVGVRESRRPDWPQQRRGGGGGRPSQNEGRGKRESAEEEEAEAPFFPNPLPRPPPQVLLSPKLDCGGAASSRENEEESGKRRGKLYGEGVVRGAVLLPRPPEITERRRRRMEAGKVFSGREGEGGEGGDRRRPVAGRRGEEEDGRDYCLVPGEEDDENSQEEEEERSAKVALAGTEKESNNHESCGGTFGSPPMEQTPSPLAAEERRIGESRVFSENFVFSTCASQTQLIPNNGLGATFKKGSEGNGVGASVLEEERSRNVIVHEWDEERQKSPLDEYFKLSFSSEQQSDGELRRSI